MHVLLYTGNSSASRTYVTAARALCSALRFGRMNLRGRFGLSCRTSSRVNLLRRRPVLHSNAESAGRHSLGIFSFISLLIEWHAGESNPAASRWRDELAKTLAVSFRAVCVASSLRDESDTSHIMELQNLISLPPLLSASRLSPPGEAAGGGNSSECAGARPRCAQCASRPKHSHRQ